MCHCLNINSGMVQWLGQLALTQQARVRFPVPEHVLFINKPLEFNMSSKQGLTNCVLQKYQEYFTFELNPLAICFYSHTKKQYYIVPSCKSSSFCSVNLKPLWQGHGLENLHMELTYVECSLVIYLHLNLHPKSTTYLTIPTVEYR